MVKMYISLYGLYPMVGVIEGFRASLLGTSPMPISLIVIGSISSIIIFFLLDYYFLIERKIHLLTWHSLYLIMTLNKQLT